MRSLLGCSLFFPLSFYGDHDQEEKKKLKKNKQKKQKKNKQKKQKLSAFLFLSPVQEMETSNGSSEQIRPDKRSLLFQSSLTGQIRSQSAAIA